MSVHAGIIEKYRPAAASRRSGAVAGGGLLSGAMLASGLLTYVFLVLAARSLGPEAYGRIGVLWGAMFIVAIVLFRPLEQTVSRSVADRLARGDEARSVLRSVAVLCAVVVVAVAAALPFVWHELARRLFHGDPVLTALLVAGVGAYGAQYVVRGAAGGVRWFPGYGLGLLADGLVRLLVAAPLVFAASQDLAAAAVVAAGVGGAAIPLVLGRRRLAAIGRRGSGERFQLRSACGFAVPAAVIAAADQLLVNGSPLLVAVAAGGHTGKATGVVFAATMLVRAPVYVFQGLAAALLPNLTHLHATDDARRFRDAVVRTTGFLAAGGLVVVAGGALVGGHAMALYGSQYHAGRLDIVLLAAGVACYLPAAALSQALLSRRSTRTAAGAWAASAAVFVGSFEALGGDPLERVSAAFALASLASLVLLGAGLALALRLASAPPKSQAPGPSESLAEPDFTGAGGRRSVGGVDETVVAVRGTDVAAAFAEGGA